MKKTLITLLALSSIAMADLTDGLQWAESFGDGFDKAPTITLNGKFIESKGVGSATSEGGRVSATDLSGGNFTDSFTFSFELVDLDANKWTNAFTMYTHGSDEGDNVLQIQMSNTGNLMVYTGGFTGSNVIDDASNFSLGKVDDLKGKQITLTMGTVGDNTVLTGYVDGVAISDTVTFTYAEGVTPSKAITGFKFGSQIGDGRGSNSVTVDNIYLWNRALSATEVAMIPEPTTATLSLLALAGLAARRRRK